MKWPLRPTDTSDPASDAASPRAFLKSSQLPHKGTGYGRDSFLAIKVPFEQKIAPKKKLEKKNIVIKRKSHSPKLK